MQVVCFLKECQLILIFLKTCIHSTHKYTHEGGRNLCGSWVFDEEKSIKGNECDGEGGEEDAR